MIGRIKGTVLEKETTRALLDVQGVAYEIDVPMTTSFQLPETGKEATLHTHLVVREDAQLLYGFYSRSDREVFRMLIKINGVGPKMALAILSGLTVDELIRCVSSSDINTLVRLPGVGKKTAERLIIELRDKLKDWDTNGPEGQAAISPAARAAGGISQQEAENALLSLGYNPREAARAVTQASAQLEQDNLEQDTEALIRLALRNMTRKD